MRRYYCELFDGGGGGGFEYVIRELPCSLLTLGAPEFFRLNAEQFTTALGFFCELLASRPRSGINKLFLMPHFDRQHGFERPNYALKAHALTLSVFASES